MKTRSIFIAISLLIFVSCKQKKQTEDISYSEEMAKTISYATNGEISNKDLIQIVFTDTVVGKDQLNKEINPDIIKLSPSIKGSVIWSNQKTLVFKPKDALPYFKEYKGSIDLAELSEKFKDKNLENLEFIFRIKGVNISSYKANLALKDRNNPKIVVYSGDFDFSEEIEKEIVEESISLKAGSKTYKLHLSQHENGYSFISEDILRDKQSRSFTLKIDKGELGLFEDFTKEFEVSAIEQMKVVNIVKDEEGKTPKIRIEFSDEIDAIQNINGMISISPSKDIKVKKMGSSIIIDGAFSFGSEYKLIVNKGLRSKWGTATTEEYTKSIKFSDIPAQVEFASDGVFLPNGNDMRLQFYTSNLKRVHIEVKKVYGHGVSEFIRSEQLSSLKDRKQSFRQSYINRIGVIVHNETLELGDEKNRWLLSELDLSGIVKKNDKGMYLIRLNFNPRDILTNQDKSATYKYIEENGQVYKPIMFSNIGLTVKRTSNKNFTIYATDITSCEPLEGVTVRLMSYYNNNEIIRSGITNSEGIVKLSYHNSYCQFIEAEKNGQKSFIKFNEMEWNNSGFDIGGVSERNDKTTAFIYTERGVYRPGDMINISVIARHRNQKYPDNKPLTLELYNPENKKVYEVTSKTNTDGFYNFPIETKDSDPTGNWRAQFHIANRTFSKIVKIETIVPYRLKVNLKPEQKLISHDQKSLKVDLECKYLFGNPASNLPAEVDLEITNVNKTFPKFTDFVFTNPCIDFHDIQKDIFNGNLNEDGIKTIDWLLPQFINVPSALNIKLTAKVLEKGGRPNINWINIPVEPYSHFVGVQKPKYYYTSTGSDVEVPAIMVDNDGTPVSGKTIEYRIYRNTKHWWWHYGGDGKLRYKTDNYTELIKEGSITSKLTHSNIRFVPIEKGSYFIEVIDASGTGHSAGIFINAYRHGMAEGTDKNAGSLAMVTDKNKYYVGDEATIEFPTPEKGLVLLTIEKNNKILSQKWIKPDGKTELKTKISITKEMVPNAYVSVSIIQPHDQTVNDRPIRMFGIVPLMVVDKDTKHEFEIQTKSQFRPEEPFEIVVQTKDNKQSQFTIAVVDEGILDITRFKTPKPWNHFFKKTLLAVSTYDIFSHVLGANLGDVFRVFSIGGDADDYRESQLKPDKGKKRFKPVSFFKGPIMTDGNGKATVKFDMPNYVGSVKIMVVGARGNSYGNAEKVVPVKSELMILPTLPRVLGPSEKIKIPVSVFAMKDNIGAVNLNITTEGPIKIIGAKSQKLSFTEADDKDCFFELESRAAAGQSKVTITAKSKQYSAKYIVDLMVRPSSPRIYKSSELTMLPGESQDMAIPGGGIEGTNKAMLTVSPYPALNFSHRLKWLIRYPYGCIEQTTSAALPQLYLKKFIKYPEAFAEEIDNNINFALSKLRRFQMFSGGFSYWPYQSEASEWGNLYAGHFMVEAKNLGYYVIPDLYENWLRYTKQQARNHRGNYINRVYRTYILALAEEADLSEMNVLRESYIKDLNNTEKWLLAASYKLSGQEDIANKIAANLNTETREYTEMSGSYGSGLRDKAMILDASIVLEKYTIADELTSYVSKELASHSWYSTQTLGYSLLAIGKYIDYLQNASEEVIIKGTVSLPGGESIPFNSDKAVPINIESGFGENVSIQIAPESTAKRIYAQLSWNGVPLISPLKDESQKLALQVKWYNEQGTPIDPSNIKQGTSFYGHFRVEHKENLFVEEIALVQILPSGWEIENTRLLNSSLPSWTKALNLGKYDYLDIRDDRIMWFFDLYDYPHSHNDYRKDFLVKINAVTVGEFDLPGTLVETMYNSNYKASKQGIKVTVTN